VSLADESFPFLFERRYAIAGRLFGVTQQRSSIRVVDGHLRARFGPWHIDTALTNLTTMSLTGPYTFIKTAGPAHLGLTDRGLTFATNSEAGVCIEFAEPITGIDPLGKIRHPNLTLTPADCSGLLATLERRRAVDIR
jgi:hypothetical protein